MPQRISLAQLIDKIQKKTLTPEEAGRYFSATANPLQPLDFHTAVNSDFVDIRGFEHLARDADPLVRSLSFPPAARTARRGARRGAARTMEAGPAAGGIVAEGDSWFRLPQLPGVPRTCIDFLQASGTPVANVAHWGDTLAEILAKGEFWPRIDHGADLLLFSAGGNDILGGGDLGPMLNLLDPDHEKPSDARWYVRQSFYDNLASVVSNLENGLIKPMKARQANKKIIMHGYDYAIPHPNGAWLGGPMASRGLDPVQYGDLCRAIVKVFIDAYNSRLSALASRYPETFIHLDLRGTIAPAQWWDELHGKEAAARAIATKLAAAIGAVKITPHEHIVARLYRPQAAA